MTDAASQARSRRAWLVVAGLALLMTGLDAGKPLHIDDVFMLRVAQQIQADPLDPYGFDIFWYQWPEPVHENLLPPVMAYWWSLGLALLGDSPPLWKLWLLPFSLLFCGSLYALARRFARGVELPLTVAVALSPAFLPSLNLMPDIPALGLGMTGLLLYLRAAERESSGLALAAGVVAGLALQTKYTSVTFLGAMLVHGVLHRRMALALIPAGVAAAMFAAWEAFATLRYGQGMFLGQLGSNLFWDRRQDLVAPFLRHLGAALSALALMGAAGLGASRRALLAAAAAILAGYALLLRVEIADPFFLALGLALLALLATSAWRLAVRPGPDGGLRRRIRGNRRDWLLLLWLGGEVVTAFVTAPFPAMRRVMGTALVASFVLGRGAALARRLRRPAVPAAVFAGLSAVLGLGFAVTDLREAQSQRDAVEAARRIIGPLEPGASIWFTGHWGFQFYAERSGMRALVPDHSQLRRGDWLVVPDGLRIDRQEVQLPTADFQLVEDVSISSGPAWVTGFGFYGGSAPLRHLPGPRLTARVLRARRDTIPRSAWTLDALVYFARFAGPETGEWVVPALSRGLAHPDADWRRQSAETLGGMGPRARASLDPLKRALDDPSPEVRAAARSAVQQISGK